MWLKKLMHKWFGWEYVAYNQIINIYAFKPDPISVEREPQVRRVHKCGSGKFIYTHEKRIVLIEEAEKHLDSFIWLFKNK